MDLFVVAIGTIFGLLLGSFLNVVIHRGPFMWKLVEDETHLGNLAAPRSYCPNCKTPLRAVHLIPVFSYLALRGKCHHCKSAIPHRYLIVELLGAISGIVAISTWGLSGSAIFAGLFFLTLISLAFIDIETGYLPDALTLPLIFGGVAVNGFNQFTTLQNSLIGAVAGYGVFWLIAVVFKKLRGIDGLGMGDAKLLAGLGAWLGWAALAPVVFMAALFALLGIGIANLQGHQISAQTPAPFGPALAGAGAFIMIAMGNNWLTTILL